MEDQKLLWATSDRFERAMINYDFKERSTLKHKYLNPIGDKKKPDKVKTKEISVHYDDYYAYEWEIFRYLLDSPQNQIIQ